jgi:hypothetical protein
MAKGMMITLGIVLLAGVLVLGIGLISKNQISHDETISFLAENELILGIDTSLEKSLGLLFKEFSGINITTEQGYLELSDSIPYSNSLLVYVNGLNQLFVKENIGWVILNVSSFEILPLMFEDGSVYTHGISGNSLEINKLDNLDLNVKLSEEIEGCNYNTEEGDFIFKVYVEGNNGTCVFDQRVDKFAKNSFDIVTKTGIVNVLLENRRFYIGNSSVSYKLRVNTNNTALFLTDAYYIDFKGRVKSGKVRVN